MVEDRSCRETPDMPDVPERISRLWRSLMGMPFLSLSKEGLWHPTANVYDRPEEIVVEIELPGMKGQQVDVSLEEEHLVVEGRRAEPDYEQEELYYLERPTGDFHRVIHLPCSVDEAGTAATYDDGILTVRLPKAERAKARRIEIT